MTRAKRHPGSGKSPDQYPPGAVKLIVTAERLFGDHGIDGVSIRQIVSAAGMVNSYSIHHHFGSKEGLVQAVYDYRVPDFEAGCRQRLAAEMENDGGVTLQGLIAARFMPLVDSFPSKIQQSYSKFLLRVLHRSGGEHPYFHSRVPQPVSHGINEQLRALFPDLPVEVFNTRFSLASDLFLGSMSEKRRLSATGNDPYSSERAYWREIINMMAGIFSEPFSG
ncbi:MAG: hypothetical protein CMK32_03270 [Porticoccaceae bacterium]|nr:hypothetical protein [Porticoccaceae bacterium]